MRLKGCVRSMNPAPCLTAIASISHEAGLYGPRLIDIGLALLRGEKVAPYNYVEHRAVTADRARTLLTAEVDDAVKAARPRAVGDKVKAATKGAKQRKTKA